MSEKDPIDPVVEPIIDDSLTPIEGSAPKVISEDAHNQVRSDMHKYKANLKQEREAREALEKQLEDVRVEKAESKEEYKSLYQTSKGQLEKSEKEKKELIDSIYLNEKIDKVEVAARKKGMNEDQIKDLSRYPEYIDMVETERTDRGRIQVHGIDEMLTQVQADRPAWFNKVKAPNINTGLPGNTLPINKELTGSQLNELEKKDKVAYKVYMKKHYNVA